MYFHLKTTFITISMLALVLIILPALSSAADISRGQEKAELCIRCHGHNGIADNPLLPNLAGQNEKYFIKQMHDFKEKRRRSAPMREISNTLTDSDIENLAAYYYSVDKQ